MQRVDILLVVAKSPCVCVLCVWERGREDEDGVHALQKNTIPWWYVFVTVGRVFCHACTSMTNLWQNQDSHTCAVVEVFHDITKIIITKVSTSMTINHASQKCFRQGWPTRGIHRNGTPLVHPNGSVRPWLPWCGYSVLHYKKIHFCDDTCLSQ